MKLGLKNKVFNKFTHIYVYRISELKNFVSFTEAVSFLSSDDLQRLTRMQVDSRIMEFVYGRYICKIIYSKYSGVDPKKLVFGYDKNAKPFIFSAIDAFHFNLSHSKDLLCFCISDKSIGIDVEIRKTVANLEAIIAEHFSVSEVRSIVNSICLEEALDKFYRLWTCKEAALKAIGVGLSVPLKTIDCEKLIGRDGINVDINNGRYSVKGEHHLIDQGKYHLAIAKCGDFGEKLFSLSDYKLLLDTSSQPKISQNIFFN